MAVGHTSQRGYNQSQRNTATHLSRLQGKMLFKSLHYFAVKWSYNFYKSKLFIHCGEMIMIHNVF